MKILHVVWTLCNGGIETMLVNIVNEQIRRGQRPAVMINDDLYDQALLAKLHCPIFRINRKPGSRNPLFLARILYYYLQYNADVVHFHSAALSKFFIFKNRHDTWIATCHSVLTKSNTFYNRRISTYTAISKCVLSDIHKNLPDVHGELCYNGLNLSRLTIKKSYSRKPTRLICVGRIEFPTKGQDIIVGAIKKLVSEGYQDIHIDFYGTGSDIDNLKQYIAQNHLSENATACGNIENETVLKLIPEYDLFIQASRYEGFGLTAVEAIGSGVPAILSAIYGHMEISDNGKYATLFKCGSSDDLAEKIKFCIENYKELTDNMPDGVAFIESNFSIENMIDRFTEIYKDSNLY